MPQGGGWGQWPQNWNGNRGKDRKEQKDKSKGKGLGGHKPALPSYDSSSTPSLSSNTTKQEGNSKDHFWRSALQEIVEQNKLEMPDQLKDMLQEETSTDLSTMLSQDQKLINQKRKLLGRVDRLKKAQERKKEQWQSFKLELKAHLTKEQGRFEQEMTEINSAIEETQLELDKLLKGETKEEVIELDQDMDEFDQWLEDTKKGANGEKPNPSPTVESAKEKEMDQVLRLTQENQRLLAQQIHEMQNQMTYMAQAIAPPMESGAQRLPLSPNGAATPQSAKKHRALEPFGRSNRSEPYAKPPEGGLNSMDGT